MADYVWRDGQRLTAYMKSQIDRLDADFFAAWGLHIIVSSGIRTNAEQEAIFRERYVTAAHINGRRVYDTRVWNGVTWYRISSAGTVAVPGTSNHEIQGNKAAVDIRDTGGDAGITVKGSARGQWLRARVGNYDMVASGDGFGEGWHFDVNNIWAAGGGGGGSWPAREKYGEAWVKAIQEKANRLGANLEVDGKDGPATQEWVRGFQGKYGLEQDGVAGPDTNAKMDEVLNAAGDSWNDQQKQDFLNSLGYDTGAPGWGAMCAAATGDFQSKVGLSVDNQFGPETTKVAKIISNGGNWTDGRRTTQEIQTRLNEMNFDAGPADNEWGNKTSLGTYRMQKAHGIEADAQFGAASEKVAWPDQPTPEPEVVPGRNATNRPLTDIQTKLGVPATGAWDKATADAVKKFQESKFIDADYIYGTTSDGFLFPPTNFGFGVDYSFARPDLQMLKERGVTFIARYLWKEKYDDGVRTNKGLSKAENDAAEALGMKVVFIYEEDGKELNKGYDAGVRVANEAEKFRKAQGLPAKPIYFNVDYDASPEEMVQTLEALKGIASVIGLERVGLYAGFKGIKAAFDAKLIAFGMQTYAWSAGQWDSRAQLRQWSNGEYDGTVDFQYAMAAEYGQTPVDDTVPIPDPDPEVPEVPVTKEELEKHRAEAAALLASFEYELDPLIKKRDTAKSLVEFFDRVLGTL